MINETNQLSEREREILRLVATGQSNQQIANTLGISINTVKVHLRNVFGKIGVASRTEATMYAVRTGLVVVNDTAAVVDQPPPAMAVPDVAVLEPPDEVLQHESLQQEPDAALQQPPFEQEATLPASTVVTTPETTPNPVDVPPLSEKPAPTRLMPRRAWLVIGGVLALLMLGAVGVMALRANQVIVPSNIDAVDAEQSRWKELPRLRTPRAGFAVANIGDQIYIIGGENQDGVLATVERYDARFQTWADLSRKPTGVADVRGVRLGGRIYVPGGRTSPDPQDVTNVFERYDPRTEQWERLPDLPEPRSGYALAELEGKLYLIGGWDGSRYRSEVFEYDPDREQWTERTAMPTPRAFAAAGVVQDSIYVLGGENESGALASNEIYTPAQEGGQPWSRRTPIPQARSRFGVAVTLRTLHIVGGSEGNTEPLKYSVGTDSWESFEAPPQQIGASPGVVQQDERIVILGGRLDDSYANTMQEYQALYSIIIPGR